jgi:hypothetical protein
LAQALLFEELFKMCNRLPTTQNRLPLSLESTQLIAGMDQERIGTVGTIDIDALEVEALRAWSLRLQSLIDYDFEMWIGELPHPARPVGPAGSIAFCKFRCAQLDAAQREVARTGLDSGARTTVLRRTLAQQMVELQSIANAAKTISAWMSGLEPPVGKLETASLRGDGHDVLASLRTILVGSTFIWRKCGQFRADPRWLNRLVAQCADSLVDFHRQMFLRLRASSASEHSLHIPPLEQLHRVEQMCEGFYSALKLCELSMEKSQLCDNVVRLSDVASIDELLHRAKVLKEIQATAGCLSEISALETPLFEDKKLNVQLQSIAENFRVHFERLAASTDDPFDMAVSFGARADECSEAIQLIHNQLQKLLAYAFASCRGADQLRKLVFGLHDIAGLPACKPVLPYALAVTIRFAGDELTELLRLTQKLQSDTDCNFFNFTRPSVHLMPPLTAKIRFCHAIKVRLAPIFVSPSQSNFARLSVNVWCRSALSRHSN